MSAMMKNYGGWIMAEGDMDAKHRDGRSVAQVKVAVRAASVAAVVRALSPARGRITRSFVDTYMGETFNEETLAALDLHPRGTVLVSPMDPGGTVRGQSGWIVAWPATGEVS